MDIDDEPPMLVEAGEQKDVPGNLSGGLEDMNLTEVPITIITGQSIKTSSLPYYVFLDFIHPSSIFKEKRSLGHLVASASSLVQPLNQDSQTCSQRIAKFARVHS